MRSTPFLNGRIFNEMRHISVISEKSTKSCNLTLRLLRQWSPTWWRREPLFAGRRRQGVGPIGSDRIPVLLSRRIRLQQQGSLLPSSEAAASLQKWRCAEPPEIRARKTGRLDRAQEFGRGSGQGRGNRPQ